MPAPSISYELTLIDEMPASGGTFGAPTIESANAAGTYGLAQGGKGWDTTSSVTGLYGGEYTLTTASSDFSTRQYIWFQLSYLDFDAANNYDTLANGGLRIAFIDGSGNWARFNIGGSDVYGGSDAFGGYLIFTFIGSKNGQSDGMVFCIDRTRTPDAESATAIDWTDVDSVQTYINTVSAQEIDMYMGRLNTADRPMITAGDVSTPASLEDFFDAKANWPNNSDSARLFDKPPAHLVGSNGSPYNVLYGYDVGDGSTTTYWRQNGGQSAFYPSRDAQEVLSDIPGYMAAFNGDGTVGHGRKIQINQAAADDVVYTNHTFSGVDYDTGEYIVEVTGSTSGACTFDTCSFFRASNVILAHATATSCVFDDVEKFEINANTALTGGIYRNSARTATGLNITGAAGNYSAIDIDFESSNTGIDLVAGSGGAGTYNCGGVTVSGGHTLNIWNPSTSNSVTVEIASGISTQAVNLWFNYDNEASGPFAEGETLTFGNGATATLVVLIDNGTTGEMYCELLTGSAPPDNNSITGGTSSATANVNEASGANSSTLTISQPATSIDVTAANLLDNTRVRLYNSTQATEIDNSVVTGGAGYSYTITDGTEYDINDTIILLATYQQAGVAKQVFRGTGVATTTDIIFTDSQVDWDDPGPNTIGIDGSTVSECSTDYLNVEVEISDPDDTTQKQRIAAFIVDAITTAEGIRNWVSLAGDAVIRYSTNTAAQIDTTVASLAILNTKATGELLIQDTFEFDWSDGTDRVSTSTGPSTLWLAPARVLSFATGSGVTAQDKTDIIDGVHNKVVENSESFIETTRLIRAATAGKSDVTGNTVTFRDAADTKDRITATVNEAGERTDVTTDSS